MKGAGWHSNTACQGWGIEKKMNISANRFVVSTFNLLIETQIKQFSFPTPFRALIETCMFAGIFFAAGYISLGLSITQMLAPMVPVTLVFMLASVSSGVYRRDITHSVLNIYIHSVYGFLLSVVGFLLVVALFLPILDNQKFVFFFLFFAFFVTNTIRPLISGTDFMDGGGRRTN
jgi:hypothetical protein